MIPSFAQMVVFNAYIDEECVPPTHGFNFESWDALYTWMFKVGLRARGLGYSPDASSNILQRLMAWRLLHPELA